MWRVHDDQASVEFGGLTARVSLVDPSRGLFDVRFGGAEIPAARLLRPRPFLPAGAQQRPDFYVRGTDLVASYPHAERQGLHRQVDWRLIDDAELSVVGLEMVVSIRTDLLDDKATLYLDSDISSAESHWLADEPDGSYHRIPSVGSQVISSTEAPAAVGLVLHRMGAERGCYIEMIHPADFSAAEIERVAEGTPLARTTWPLFCERLEKGVIRRARARAVFSTSADDQVTAAECYRRFANSPPPLTV